MVFVPLYSGFARTSLLVCDVCDGVLPPEGETTTKAHRESDPSDLAPRCDEPSMPRRVASSPVVGLDGQRRRVEVRSLLHASDEMADVAPVSCVRCFAMSPVHLAGRREQPCVVCDQLVGVRTIEA